MIVPPAAAREVVSRAPQLYLRLCPCRVEFREAHTANAVREREALRGMRFADRLRGEQHCPPETWEVCLLLPAAPPERRAEGRPITTAEALAILERTAAQGLISHLFYRPADGRVTEICSCCTCCCRPLHRIRSEHRETTEHRSAYLAVTDPQRCAACGTCVAACFFAARRIEEGALLTAKRFAELDAGRCFGCGRCVRACPAQAIRLEAQPGRGLGWNWL